MKKLFTFALICMIGALHAQSTNENVKKPNKSIWGIFSKKEGEEKKKEEKPVKSEVFNPITAPSSGVAIAEPDTDIKNPALRIRTKTREFILGYRTTVSIITTDDIKIKSNIVEVDDKSLTVAKDNTNIPFDKIKTIRIRPTRRFWKWISMPTVVFPIYWTCLSKGVHINSRNCKKSIQEFKLVNKYVEFKYGKDYCQ